MLDYYQILGVDKNASGQTIRTAYKKLALEHHPDRNPHNPRAEEQFKEINTAYQILSDPEKRQNYDLGIPNTIAPPSPESPQFFYDKQTNTYHFYQNKDIEFGEPQPIIDAILKKRVLILSVIGVLCFSVLAIIFGQEMQKYTARLYYDEAVKFFNKKHYYSASVELNEALKFDKNNYKIFLLRGRIYLINKRYRFALEDLNKAIKISQKPHARVHYYKAKTLYKMSRFKEAKKEYRKALEEFDKALKDDPYESHYYHYKAKIYQKIDKEKYKKEIKKNLDKALEHSF